MRAHPSGSRALAAALAPLLAASFTASSGCGESFSSDATVDGGVSGVDGAGTTDAGALSAFCEAESHNSPMFDLCDSFDDRGTDAVVGKWNEVQTGAYAQIALSIDNSASVSHPASLRIQRATSGAEAGHFLSFDTDFGEGQTWVMRGSLTAQFAPSTASASATFAPIVVKVLSAQIPVAHAFLKFDVFGDTRTPSASAVGAGVNPFSAAAATTYSLQRWESPRLFKFAISVTRPAIPSTSPSVSVQLDSATTTFQLDRAPSVLVNPRLQIQLGGFAAAGGWDFHADNIVITHN
jgi:hypothetical protein